MEHPSRIELPFFAYGLFRPGQLAFFQLRDLVSDVTDPASVAGNLLLRDGLPIISPSRDGCVSGALLAFKPDRAKDAYDRISDMEPDEHYRWHVAQVAREPANVLMGKSPHKGSVPCEEGEWNGWNDPLFTAALDVVEEALNSSESQNFEWNLKPLFRLQMAYLLLWSSIERYVSLRYHLGSKVTAKLDHLAREPAFAEGLVRRVQGIQEVYRADRPRDRKVLDPQAPEKSVHYYYQVRSNITHRGKGVVRDFERVKGALAELLPIFRDVLESAQRDAGILA